MHMNRTDTRAGRGLRIPATRCLLALSCTLAASSLGWAAADSAVDVVKPADAGVLPASIKDVRVLSDRWIALVIDTTAEILGEVEQQSGPIDPGKKQYASFAKEMRGDWRLAQKCNNAIGAALAAPDRKVIGVCGDGDFMATMQELAVAVQKELPIVYVVMNNRAWQSIENLQLTAYGENRGINTRFMAKDGSNYSPDFVEIAKGFGARAAKVTAPAEMGKLLRDALDSGRTSVIEVPCAVKLPYSGIKKYAWWDMPVPEYMSDLRKEYESARAGEKL